MAQTPPQSAEHLLERTREQVRLVAGAAFLLYFLLVNLLKIPAQTPELQGGRWWGVAGVLIYLVLNGLGILKNRLINLATYILVILALWFGASQALRHGLSPIPLVLWTMFLSTTFYVMLGSVTGTALSLFLGLGLGALVVVYPPIQSMLFWVTSGVLLLGLCIINFIFMQFIEQNVVLHDQASDKLRAARRDALTGVQGRAALEEELRRAIRHAHKSGTPLSVIMTDIDHFKRVNDQHGHSAGDDVLRSFAKRLRRNVGGMGGSVGRWGGEEFLVIIPGMARPDAVALAEHLREQVSISPIAGLEVTASFGVASVRRDDDIDELFARADERLYEAKNAGRNLVR